MIIERIDPRQKHLFQEMETLLAESELRMEPADLFLGGYENGMMITCGALAGSVIKMLAVRKDRMNEGLITELVSALLKETAKAQTENVYIFTKPEYLFHFSGLGFRKVINTEEIVLFHRGKWTPETAWAEFVGKYDAPTYAVVINANPFTNGHLHLIESACAEEAHVLVFVVEEDVSFFPFRERFAMVQEALADRSDVTVLPSGPYAVSSVSFPTYFLRKETDIHREYAKLDALLFKKVFVTQFGIRKRFVGEEPFSDSTRVYNQVLAEVLPPECEVVRIPRLADHYCEAISATRIRAWIKEERWEEIRSRVPDATWKRIRNHAGFVE